MSTTSPQAYNVNEEIVEREKKGRIPTLRRPADTQHLFPLNGLHRINVHLYLLQNI